MHPQHVITDEEHVKRQATSWDLASPGELFLSVNALIQCPCRSWTFTLNHPVREPQDIVVSFVLLKICCRPTTTRVEQCREVNCHRVDCSKRAHEELQIEHGLVSYLQAHDVVASSGIPGYSTPRPGAHNQGH